MPQANEALKKPATTNNTADGPETPYEAKIQDWYQANETISGERYDFLRDIRNKVARQLSDGPVLLGENHNFADANTVILDLIADGKVKNLLVEDVTFSRDLAANGGHDVLKLVKEKGYESVEHYLDTSTISPRLRRDPEILRGLVDFYSSRDDLPSSHAQTVIDAMRAGVNVYPIDARRMDLSPPGYDMDFRNRYMAWNIKQLGLNEPGTIGSFGARHLTTSEYDGRMVPPIQNLAGIDNSRVYNLTPAFQDFETGKFYPRWGELSKRGITDLATGLYVKTLEAKRTNSSLLGSKGQNDGKLSYVPAKYEHRIVVDSANNAGSQVKANKLLQKYPVNTLLLKDTGRGRLEYVAGQFVTSGPYITRTAKVTVLRNPTAVRGATSKKGVLAALSRKLSNDLIVKKIETVKVSKKSGSAPSHTL